MATQAFAQTASGDTAPSSECQAGDRACGRDAYTAGTQGFDRGDYAAALAQFRSARSAAPHPSITFNIALCLARLGKPTQAKAELRALLAAAETPEELKKRANDELTLTQRMLAHIALQTPAGSSYAIELDGQKAEAGAELEVDPGEHRLRVTSPSAVVFDQPVKLEAGEQLRLRVTDQARVIDVVVVPEAQKANAPVEAPAPQVAAKHGLPPAVFYAAASASAVLGAVTIWSGLDVKSAYNDYQHDLPHLSQEEADARVADGHARERRTNILLGATAVAVVATTALAIFWVDFGGRNRSLAVGISGNGCSLRSSF